MVASHQNTDAALTWKHHPRDHSLRGALTNHIPNAIYHLKLDPAPTTPPSGSTTPSTGAARGSGTEVANPVRTILTTRLNANRNVKIQKDLKCASLGKMQGRVKASTTNGTLTWSLGLVRHFYTPAV